MLLQVQVVKVVRQIAKVQRRKLRFVSILPSLSRVWTWPISSCWVLHQCSYGM